MNKNKIKNKTNQDEYKSKKTKNKKQKQKQTNKQTPNQKQNPTARSVAFDTNNTVNDNVLINQGKDGLVIYLVILGIIML